jgi:hypothetical protein
VVVPVVAFPVVFRVPLLPVPLRSEPTAEPPMVPPVMGAPVPRRAGLTSARPEPAGPPSPAPAGRPVLVEEPGARAEPLVLRFMERLSLPVVPPADPLLLLGVVVEGWP